MKKDISDTDSSLSGAAAIPSVPLGFKIINWIGIIDQLTTTQMRQILSETELPPPQFVLLNHFSHRPQEGKTVSKIAWAMQQPQPGITKTVSKLVKKGYLRDEANPEDGRSKNLFITETGKNAHRHAQGLLMSSMGDTFDNWPEQDMEQLFELLDRLKVHFDSNR